MSRPAAIAIAVVALAAAALGATLLRSPWRAWQATWGAPFPTDDTAARWTVSVTAPPRANWETWRDSVGARFVPTGVELWQRGPLGVVYAPFRLPVAAVGRCDVFTRHAPVRVVGLWLPAESRWLVFENGMDQAIEWCRERGLVVAD